MQIEPGHVAVVTRAPAGSGSPWAERSASRVSAWCSPMSRKPPSRRPAALTEAGVDVRTVRCDVTSLESVQALADAAFDWRGAVNVLCNNAGVVAFGGAFESLDDWRWVIDVDMWGVVHGLHAFVPHARLRSSRPRREHGLDGGGLLGFPNIASYVAAKHAVVGMSQSMFHELRLRPWGCRCSVPASCDQHQHQPPEPSGHGRPPSRSNSSERTAPGHDASGGGQVRRGGRRGRPVLDHPRSLRGAGPGPRPHPHRRCAARAAPSPVRAKGSNGTGGGSPRRRQHAGLAGVETDRVGGAAVGPFLEARRGSRRSARAASMWPGSRGRAPGRGSRAACRCRSLHAQEVDPDPLAGQRLGPVERQAVERPLGRVVEVQPAMAVVPLAARARRRGRC